MNPIIDRLEAYLKPQWMLVVFGTAELSSGFQKRAYYYADEKYKLVRLAADYISLIDSQKEGLQAEELLNSTLLFEHVYRQGYLTKYIHFKIVEVNEMPLDDIYSRIKGQHYSRE